MTPIVSILIPAYNVQPWIAETLRSALAQTWPRKEIIVVDDGSRDQTLEIAKQFASESVSVVTQENGGGSAARNKAFELCQGEYIQWLDADDLLGPDKIAKQMEKAEQCQSKRTVLSSAWGYFMYRPHRARFIPTVLWGDLTPLEWLLLKWEHNVHMNPATWLVSREVTQAAGPWNTRLMCGEDGEYFCRVLLASDGSRFVPEARVLYRARASSASYVGRSNKKMEALFLQMQLEIGHLRSLDDGERTRAACLRFLQTWLGHFYPDRLDIVKQAGELAAGLGGHLETPRLSWKYEWIQKLFGWGLARRAQLGLPGLRSSLARSWDKAMFRIEERKSARVGLE
ncbi:MAG TPA: glycosyltransferase family 2 protein [Candidatus Acidoferrum sp.]|jgi:glycosyltransferase involved in cell wall biosynthesis|nr:glycosyltransferase family 2 protein [Candidatus Acidoferrum sp.]